MSSLDLCINALRKKGHLGNIAVRVGQGDKILIDRYVSDNVINEKTLFDMASVSKIICVTSLALVAVSKGMLCFEDKVGKFFDVPKDKKELSVKHLLTHTMGIGHKNLCMEGVNYDNVGEYILSVPCEAEIGSEVIYSCPGFILLGKLLERLFGERLDMLLGRYVTQPLGMADTCYLPEPRRDFAPCNFRAEPHRVNDYNCDFLGGIAGNAGVFSNICDMTLFAKMLISFGAQITDKNVFLEAIKNHTPEKSSARGLGYLYVDKRYTQTGRLFPVGSFGHCGHTGQSVFVNAKSGLYAIILTDMTASFFRKYGKYDYNDICRARESLHNAVADELNM